jgi:hypothetical protein
MKKYMDAVKGKNQLGVWKWGSKMGIRGGPASQAKQEGFQESAVEPCGKYDTMLML